MGWDHGGQGQEEQQRESTRDNLLESSYDPWLRDKVSPSSAHRKIQAHLISLPRFQLGIRNHLPNPTGNQKDREPSDIVIAGQPPRTDKKDIWRSKRQLSSTYSGFPWSTEQLSNRRKKNTGFLILIPKPFPFMPLCVLGQGGEEGVHSGSCTRVSNI